MEILQFYWLVIIEAVDRIYRHGLKGAWRGFKEDHKKESKK